MVLPDLGQAAEVIERRARPAAPVVIVGLGFVEVRIELGQHVDELTRRVGLVGPAGIAKSQQGIGNGNGLALRQGLMRWHGTHRRRRRLVTQLRPFAADHPVGTGAGRLEETVEGAQVLHVEGAAEGRRIHAEVAQAGIEAALRRLDPATGLGGIVMGVEHVEVARPEGQQEIGRRRDMGGDAQGFAQDGDFDAPVAGGVGNIEDDPRRTAFDDPVAIIAGPWHRAQGDGAAVRPADDHPDRVAAGAHLGCTLAQNKGGQWPDGPAKLGPDL